MFVAARVPAANHTGAIAMYADQLLSWAGLLLALIFVTTVVLV
jgi:hypothetical protein